MATALAYLHLEKPADAPARLARLPRIRVAQIVMDYLHNGWSPDEMCRQYPHLKPAEVHAAMVYYYDHRAEIDGEIAAERKEVERIRATEKPSPFELRMRAEGRL